jgi:hypothetical protein
MSRNLSAPYPLLLLATALTSGGCWEESTTTSAAGTVTDSAGIVIAENPATALAGAAIWTVAPTPSLEIRSSDEAGFTLFEVVDVVPLPDGGLAVLNGGADEVLLFDAAGDYRLRLGGEGDGPGEFRQITSAVPMPGDSLAVFDRTHRRLSVFDEGGRLGREVAIELEGSPYAQLLGLSSGDLVVYTRGDFGRPRREGSFRVETESYRIGPDGTREAAYGPFPGVEVFTISLGAGPTLFGATTYAAGLGDELVIGTAEEPELRLYAPSGALSRIIRWEQARQPVTDEDVAAFVEAMATLVPEAQRASQTEAVEQLPRAPVLPPYQGLLAAPSGELWVGSYRGPVPLFAAGALPWPPQSWRVFDAEGLVIATVETPARFRTMALLPGGVVGVFEDDLGIESVRVYALSR